MKSSLVALNLTLLICLLSLILVSGEQRISEREILLQFRSSVADDPSGVLSGWSSNGSHHCSWSGVTCDSDSRVIAINVTGCQDRGKVGSFYGFGSRKACQFVQGALGGKLSPLIGELTQLRILSLAWNKLDGEIPLEIWDLERLEILDLEGNCFCGKLPSQFIGLRKLKILSLGFNKIEGNISMSLSQCVDLEVLSLAGNMFNGLFPEFLGRFAKIKVVSLSSNMLNGSIPENIGGNCSYLEHLDFSNNLLSGKLPDSLGHCWRLKTLLLSSNMLSGVIPKQLGGLPDLDVVDISGNDLSGSIPGNLIKWSYRTALVRDNNRSLVEVQSLPNKMTPLPDVPSRKLSDEFAPNSSDGVQYADSPTNVSSLNKSLNAVEVASIVSASAIVSLLLVLLVIFIYTRKRVPKSKKHVYGSMEIVIFVDIGIPLTYENVVEATGNFSANNCIGHGGFGATYKAEIAPGTLVAVKRLSVGRFQGVKQFDAEIRTLGTARHPNLVKLIGYHASEKEMFLIYNYLPGGNLENFIKERTTKVVEWKTIYRIALDIANALAYLHHQCTPKILHRDVKPSNILLDNELNASLSDFGLSRLLGPSETHATTSVAGTFGYVAPEYAMTCRVSEKADVYSYGIVLLELISDKKALDPSFSSEADGFNIVSWASMLLQQGQGRDVFSSNLWEVSPHESLIEMLHLAIKCTVDSLSTRPTMKQVVQQLRRIQPL